MKRENTVTGFAVATYLTWSLVVYTVGGADKKEKRVRPIEQAESHLREIIQQPDGPQEIYALLSEGTWGGAGQRSVLVFKEHAVLHCDDGNGRTRERDLTTTESGQLVRWLSLNKVDQLSEFDEGTADGIQYEYFHGAKGGGEHRVLMNNPPGAPIGAGAVFGGSTPAPKRKLYGELTGRMLKLDRAPMRVIYESLDKVPGFQVVQAKENGEVAAISYGEGQLLAGVLASYDKPIKWHVVKDGRLSNQFKLGPTDQFGHDIPGYYNWHKADVMISEGLLTGKRLWAGDREKDKLEALWISSAKGEPQLFARGTFADAIVCPGGEWVVVAKTPPGDSWAVPNGVVRIHIPTKRDLSVDLPPADNFNPIAWVQARKRVLLYQQRDWQDWKAGPEKPEFYLLDPVTGAHEKAEGEMRPFFDAGKHELQATGNPNEFWAALHSSVVDPKLHTTTVGRFDSYNFRFTPLLTFPDVEFESSNFFVDQPAHLIWISVNGDLLRLSLPQ